MAQTIREIMTAQPVTMEDSATVFDAARAMRDAQHRRCHRRQGRLGSWCRN